MKTFRKILPVVLLLSTFFTAGAQLRLGVRGGVHFAKQSYKVEDFFGFNINTDNITAISLAGMAEITVAGDFAVQPELSFIQKGGKLETEDEYGEKSSAKNVINHIDVPILLKYKFGSEKIGGYLAAGPAFGYALSGTTEANGEKEDIDFKEAEYKRFEESVNFGGGIGINVGSGQVFLDLRYNWGLTDHSDEEEDAFTTKNKGFGISLGYLFSLGK
jgi:hypothetical protein